MSKVPSAAGEIATTPSVDAVLSRIAARQHGLLRLVQLLAAGLDHRAISRRVAAGKLHRVFQGVYALGHRGLSREGRWLAAVFAAGSGAGLSHLCATAHWKLRQLRTDFVDVVAPTRHRLKGPVRVHGSRTLVPDDIVVLRGIPVTTVARTLVDLTDMLTEYQLANVIHEAEYLSLFSVTATREAMGRAHGRHNLHVLDAALALNAAGSAGTRSAGEDAMISLLRAAGIAIPLVNTILLGEELDFLWPARRLNVEVDGRHHRRRRTKADDERRDAKLRAHGYTVVRFPSADVERRPAAVVGVIRRSIAA